jgi:hypothetical protein
MSIQCTKCLKVVREISDNGVDVIECSECEWRLPHTLCENGGVEKIRLIYPKKDYENYAKELYFQHKLYMEHQIDDPNNNGGFVVSECNLTNVVRKDNDRK